MKIKVIKTELGKSANGKFGLVELSDIDEIVIFKMLANKEATAK